MSALQNVSDVLDDPDFNTELVLASSAVAVEKNGLASALSAGKTFLGVVIPDGGPDLIQTGEGDAVEGDITVYTRHPLTTGDSELGADIVGWNGAAYTVIEAPPWLYGDGYTRAVCKLRTLNPSQVPPDHNAGYLG